MKIMIMITIKNRITSAANDDVSTRPPRGNASPETKGRGTAKSHALGRAKEPGAGSGRGRAWSPERTVSREGGVSSNAQEERHPRQPPLGREPRGRPPPPVPPGRSAHGSQF